MKVVFVRPLLFPLLAMSALAAEESIVGEWVRLNEDAPAYTFAPDGTLRIQQKGRTITAKYRVDTSKTPHHLDLTEIDARDLTGGRDALLGIFQFESDNRIKMELGAESGGRPEKFSEFPQFIARAGGASAGRTIVGEWRSALPLKETYTFRADGTVRSFYQHRDDPPREKEYIYKLEGSGWPRRLNFYFRPNGDPAFRGIVQLEGNSRLKLEGKFTSNEAERPKSFGKDVEIYERRR